MAKNYRDDIVEEILTGPHLPDHEVHYYHPSHDRLPPNYTFGCGGPIVVVLVVVYVLYRVFCAPQENPAERYLQKPEEAVVYYLKTVEDYLRGGRGVYARDVMFCVTEDDKWWFEHQYQSIASSRDSGAPVPTAGERNLPPAELALRVLLGKGPMKAQSKVSHLEAGVTLASCTVTEIVPIPEEKRMVERTFDVELKVEHGLWKIVGFAGSRKYFQ